MKKALLGLALSPLFLLASPQNLANISDLKESIALMIGRLNTLEQEMDTLKKEQQNNPSSQVKEDQDAQEAQDEEESQNNIQEKVRINDKNTKEDLKKVQSASQNDFSKLNEQVQSLQNEIEELKKQEIPPKELDNNIMNYPNDLQSEIEDLKKELLELKDKNTRTEKAQDSQDKKVENANKDDKTISNSNTKLEEQYKDFVIYVNRKIEELENKIVSKKDNVDSIVNATQTKSNECSYSCLSKADFSNYKFERIRKEKNFQKQIDVLKKQLDELNDYFRKIKSYYEGS